MQVSQVLFFISANIIVRDNETDVELIETVADVTVNVEVEALKSIDLQNLRKALSMLSKAEYDLMYYLFLAKHPLSEPVVATKLGISQQAVSKRKKAVLCKLKKYF